MKVPITVIVTYCTLDGLSRINERMAVWAGIVALVVCGARLAWIVAKESTNG
jgi:hypothetical protein